MIKTKTCGHDLCAFAETMPPAYCAYQPWPVSRECTHDECEARWDGRTPTLRCELTGTVYYAQRGGLIKIGWTRDLGRRLLALRKGSAGLPGLSGPLYLLASEPGGPKVEAERHRVFAEYRVGGEWFRHDGLLRTYVAALAGAR